MLCCCVAAFGDDQVINQLLYESISYVLALMIYRVCPGPQLHSTIDDSMCPVSGALVPRLDAASVKYT